MSVFKLFNAEKWGSRTAKDPLIASWFGGDETESGESVTPDNAMKCTAVMAAVRVISETIASLPLFLYRRTKGGGKARAFDLPLYTLLHDQPNRWQTSFEFREMMVGHMVLRGNAYAEIFSTPGRGVSELIPLNPDRVRPFRAPDGRIAYYYQPATGGARVILQNEMLHWRDFSSDGIVGESRITQAAETIGLSMAVEKYAGRFFKNDAKPGGILLHPGTFKDKESIERFKESWQAAQAGVNKHKTAVLEQGITYKEIGISNKDSQFLELRGFQVADIARIFRVPPHMIGDLTKSAFSNIEQQSIDFVVHTIRPWLVRIEQALRRDILTEKQRATLFVAFVVDGLLRGDVKSRYEAYSKGRNDGWLSANDIRKKENMNPINGGDVYLIPLNMQSADALGAKQPLDSDVMTVNEKRAELGLEPIPEGNAIFKPSSEIPALEFAAPVTKSRGAKALKNAAALLATKESKAVNAARARLDGIELVGWLKDFYAKHIGLVADALALRGDIVKEYFDRVRADAVLTDINEVARFAALLELGGADGI